LTSAVQPLTSQTEARTAFYCNSDSDTSQYFDYNIPSGSSDNVIQDATQ